MKPHNTCVQALKHDAEAFSEPNFGVEYCEPIGQLVELLCTGLLM
jgi:hypothetical protein